MSGILIIYQCGSRCVSLKFPECSIIRVKSYQMPRLQSKISMSCYNNVMLHLHDIAWHFPGIIPPLPGVPASSFFVWWGQCTKSKHQSHACFCIINVTAFVILQLNLYNCRIFFLCNVAPMGPSFDSAIMAVRYFQLQHAYWLTQKDLWP